MHTVDHCDFSGIHVLENIVGHYRDRGGDVFIVRARPPVMRMMQLSGFDRLLGADHFLAAEEAIDMLFRRVLDPCFCVHRCRERVFAECQAVHKHPVAADEKLPRFAPIPLAAGIESMAPEVLRAHLEDGGDDVAVVDVREAAEQDRYVAGARLLPLRQLLDRVDELPEDRPVVFVCRSGRRSRHAVRMMQVAGRSGEFCLLDGGLLAWEAAGYPLAVGPGPGQGESSRR